MNDTSVELRAVGLRRWRAIVPALALLLAYGAPTSGAALSFTGSFGLPAVSGVDPDLSGIFGVPRFNPALGTLNAASYTVVRSGLQYSWALDMESGSSVVTTATAIVRTSLHHSGGKLADGLTLFQLTNFTPPNILLGADSDGEPDFIGSDAHTFFGAAPTDTVTDTIMDGLLLGAFTGTGAVPLELRVGLQTLLNNSGCCHPAVHISLSTVAAQWFWQYDYTPAIVDPGPGPSPAPEPATLLLVSVGAAALGWRQRRGPSVPSRAGEPSRTFGRPVRPLPPSTGERQ
jgi:hypothetical protein